MATCIASARIALLGCGGVGAAFTRLIAASTTAPMQIVGALVRDPEKPRSLPIGMPFTNDVAALLDDHPDVVVELLGGVEPARTVVLQALARKIPVVTANKTLLARHGSDLRRAVRENGTPLLYEAAVIAGVPFLGTFARRPQAACASHLVGIANGTSNFILSRCNEEERPLADGVTEAQRLGYAEPDPAKDVSGADAVEKLVVLLQHFAGFDVAPDSVETCGIQHLTPSLLTHARELGGAIKPVIHAGWSGRLEAFAGPAYLPASHVLARVDGVENALALGTPHGRLVFQGPGAGPDVTAATVLDDVGEVVHGRWTGPPGEPLVRARAASPETGWLIALEGTHLPKPFDVADYLGSHGIYVRQSTPRRTRHGIERQAYLTWPAPRPSVDEAVRRVCAAAHCSARHLRTLEEPLS